MSGCRQYKRNRWYPFDVTRGARQALPAPGRPVLVRCKAPDGTGRIVIAIGIRHSRGVSAVINGTHHYSLPHFELPHGGTNVEEWNDCLKKNVLAADLTAKTFITRESKEQASRLILR